MIDLTTTRTLRFVPTDFCFKPIATYLFSVLGMATVAEVYNGDGRGVSPWAADDFMDFGTAACNVNLTWSPRDVAEAMIRNGWPQQINLGIETSGIAGTAPAGSRLHLGVFEGYFFGLGQALITNFVENQKKFLSSSYGNVNKWPPVWQFARIVRNTMAHDGKIDIRDGARVSWRKLAYSNADNGKSIINIDLWPGDLFILVKDMEQALT